MTNNKAHTLFTGLQKKLEASLEANRIVHDHAVTKGDVTEGDWLKLFHDHLPMRYQATKGFAVDSKGGCSEQIDIIIHDRQYTPYLYNAEGVVYVPAESIYAVFEVKQNINKEHLEYAHKKAESVRQLHRTSIQVVHIDGVSEAKPLHQIIGGILVLDSDYSPAFSDVFQKLATTLKLELGCVLKHGAFELSDKQKLYTHENDTPLATFFMKLLSKLQVIGTVPAIDYNAYFNSEL